MLHVNVIQGHVLDTRNQGRNMHLNCHLLAIMGNGRYLPDFIKLFQGLPLSDFLAVYHPSRSASNWLAESRTRLHDSQCTFSIRS